MPVSALTNLALASREATVIAEGLPQWSSNPQLLSVWLISEVVAIPLGLLNLLLLRHGSSIAFQCYIGLQKPILLIISVVWFNDTVLQQTGTTVGVIVSFISGTWYSGEVAMAGVEAAGCEEKAEASYHVEENISESTAAPASLTESGLSEIPPRELEGR